MNGGDQDQTPLDAGAFGVNYALRPHKFIDRKVFIEVLQRFSGFCSLDQHVYVGLGSFSMEDHKLINAAFGLQSLISLEVNQDVLLRQKYNAPLACIQPTGYSTSDYVARKSDILRHARVEPSANSIVWFDMTDAETVHAHIGTFISLLESSEVGDVVRFTVDVDLKTLGRPEPDEGLDELNRRRFAFIRELLGDLLNPGAKARDLTRPLGAARLVLHAFRIAAEEAFRSHPKLGFEPISITTYADGHRMLSLTGAVLERTKLVECRSRMKLETVPGGSMSWDDLVNIQVPQLTVWEKLTFDRKVHKITSGRLARELRFRLHETIPTVSLLEGYATFQRFYPNFRHVIL